MQVPREKLARATVRNYQPGDRQTLRTICYETGLMGEPIDPHFGCLDLFADYWMNYYTDHEPESAFVAELDGRVIGYLVGCKDTKRQQEIQAKVILPRIRRKLFTFGYKIDYRFFSFMWRYTRSMVRREFPEEPIDDYPAHLHMNLIDGCRSGGVGSRLMSAYFDYLGACGVKGIHLGTTSHNTLAVPFYKKWGFALVSRHPFTMYEGIIPERVELLFFTRRL
ncbi:MAG: GNAT family N-acetyltransferase [Candidatus Abyssubacteria bacterium]